MRAQLSWRFLIVAALLQAQPTLVVARDVEATPPPSAAVESETDSTVTPASAADTTTRDNPSKTKAASTVGESVFDSGLVSDDDWANDAPAHRRGSVAIGYQTQHTLGMIDKKGTVLGKTTTDNQVMNFSLKYQLNERWHLAVALPWIRKRSSGGPGAHQVDNLDPPNNTAPFLDDGDYHGGWQDWTLGLTYQTEWRGFRLEPHAVATIPSHNYPHYGNAAFGQNLWKLRLGFDLSRRLELSDFYYSFGYSYEIWESVLGINLNKHHLRASAGYFLSPRWSARVFAVSRTGNGLNTDDFPITDRRSESWYQHDRTSQHSYVLAGLNTEFRISDTLSLSLSAGRMVRGRNIHDLRSLIGIELIRAF